MSVFQTSRERAVEHCHLGLSPQCESDELTAAKIEEYRAAQMENHPDAREIRPPTNRYNCVGYALARSHGWFNFQQPFFTDDYTEASFDSPARGDVVKYTRLGAFMHVAVVTQVIDGLIIRVRSKWGSAAELSHRLDGVGRRYGKPTALLRPRPGVVAFPDLPEEEELSRETVIVIASAISVTSVISRGDEEMPEFNSTEEAIQGALESISNPRVYVEVGFASTPEAARIIIADLPGVQDLIEIGARAANDVLQYWRNARERQDKDQLAVALYLLQRIPMKEAVQPLAKAISEGEISGLNMYLAADALLTSAEIETVNESPLTVALREARRLK